MNPWVYLNALQLHSDALLLFNGAVLGLGQLMGKCHVLQLQVFHGAKLSHLPRLRETGWCEKQPVSTATSRRRVASSLPTRRIPTCMLAISLCSRTLASWASASCCWYHCLTCCSESISAWEVFSRLWRVLRSSWTCCSWPWRPDICWRKSWTAKNNDSWQKKRSFLIVLISTGPGFPQG